MTALSPVRERAQPGRTRHGRWVGTHATCAALLLTCAAANAAEPAAEATRPWARVVALLQYLSSDYPLAVASRDAFELEEQVQLLGEVMKSTEALGEKARPYLPRLRAVQERVARHADASGVQRDTRALAEELMTAVGLKSSPPHPPNLAKGEHLFNASCAACHGSTGRGDGPAAAGLTPAPANLASASTLSTLTPYRVFNATSFGVPGTAMQGFANLSADERWDVAFYVLSLSKAACAGLPKQVALEQLASRTDAELSRAHGAGALACLRRAVPEAVAPGSVRVARQRVLEAARAARAGRLELTRDVLLDAYIFEIESVEPLMWSRDPELVRRLERAFAEARTAIDEQPARVGAELEGISRLLDAALRVVSR